VTHTPSAGDPIEPKTTGLVLSGGGMRGAYEVGVVAGIADVLDRDPAAGPLFQVFSGTSVGAINAAFFAARSDRADHAVERLAEVWRGLRLADHARVRPLGLAPMPDSLKARLLKGGPRSLLDTRALEVLVRRSVDWELLHKHVDQGLVHALMIAALHIVSGRTTMFTEKAPHVMVEPTRDERRVTIFERITADHVLASAALPLLFPTRRLGSHYYCDGGLRFNTPIAPAIRAGAERLVVVSVRHTRTAREVEAVEEADLGLSGELSPIFLVGKLLNALLLDPVEYDLSLLERLNQVLEVLEQTLPPEELERVQRVWARHRGIPYRRIQALVFTPSRDLGRIAGDYIRANLDTSSLNAVTRYFFERFNRESGQPEADWASYLLFDGGFAHELIEAGRADALAQAAKIREFFGVRAEEPAS
jgi:NTE family protein